MPKPGKKYGKWTVGERLGSGGQGAVYEATGGEGEPTRAIKIVRPHRIKKRERFLLEIKAQADLTFRGARNVLPLLDSNFDEVHGGGVSGYIVMPKAQLSLETALPTLEGRIELSLEVFAGVLNGVREAHAASIIHRDLKPANILFLDASLKEPLVADFGICLLKETPDSDRLTDEGETVGARYYMAPEQEKGGVSEVTETADIYSLGKLLHHMLTGRTIYREEIEAAFRPTELESDPRYQRILDRIIRRTVLQSPAARIQTVEELIAVVQSLRDEGRGGTDSHDSGGHPRTSPPAADARSTEGDSETGAASSVGKHYDDFMKVSGQTGTSNYLVMLDQMRRDFTTTWKSFYERIKDDPAQAPEAAKGLIRAQSRPLALTLALGRANAVRMFPEWKRFLEALIREDEPRSGYPAVFGVPHVLGGFLYMAATMQALSNESWDVLTLLLNEQFEWYYRSDRPFYSYGFELSFLFHSEALGREASKTHNLYRELLGEPPVLEVITLSADQVLNRYLQAQLLMSLRVVQEVERGNEAHIWPDYGRFYEWRVRPLFDRAYAVEEYGEGLARAFKETPKEFWAKLDSRLAYVPKHFWSGSQFMWESIGRSGWTPR